MSLTTIMYHFVFDKPPEKLKGIPYLSAEKLREHLDYMLAHGHILRKNEDIHDFIDDETENRFFATFDDSLKCHFDIVLPIIEEYDIQCGFSIYTDPITKKTMSLLEKQRYLQYSIWEYTEFLNHFIHFALESKYGEKYKNKLRTDLEYIESHSFYLAEETYYTKYERYFRYCRDVVFAENEFSELIDSMFKQYCNEQEITDQMFLNQKELQIIHDKGHTILAHSLSHPMRMDLLTKQQMDTEITQSLNTIESLTGQKPQGFAYPCGRVNPLLFKAVEQAGIDYAFVGGDSSNFNVPGPGNMKLFRVDAADFSRIIHEPSPAPF